MIRKLQFVRRQAICSAIRTATLLALLLAAFSANAQTRKLDRGWQLLTDKDGALKLVDLNAQQNWRNARVGVSWNAQFADLRDYMGAAWYRTTLTHRN
jgi:predicted 3-demethylubiquinone-9 3-methyltransferase (glyoxalase superfamily)